METYNEKYHKILIAFDNAKHAIMGEIVNMIKTIACKPVHIGNMYYYYVRYGDIDVPAYCNERDYNNGYQTFMPIYDENDTGVFGWTNFEECCRIFEAIRRKLLNN